MGGYTPADFQNMGMPRLYYKLLRRHAAAKASQSNLNAPESVSSTPQPATCDAAQPIQESTAALTAEPHASTLMAQTQTLTVGRSACLAEASERRQVHAEPNLNASAAAPNLNAPALVKVPKPRSKVAKLPQDVQNNLNAMLADGRSYTQIIHWLSGGGYPAFNKVNLHNWRITGFQAWLRSPKAEVTT